VDEKPAQPGKRNQSALARLEEAEYSPKMGVRSVQKKKNGGPCGRPLVLERKKKAPSPSSLEGDDVLRSGQKKEKEPVWVRRLNSEKRDGKRL